MKVSDEIRNWFSIDHCGSGLLVSNSECDRHVTCPTCGAQLRVSHELVPEFYATARVTREEASDGEGQD